MAMDAQVRTLFLCCSVLAILILILQIASIALHAKCHSAMSSTSDRPTPEEGLGTGSASRITERYQTSQVRVQESSFGTLSNGTAVDRFTLTNGNGLSIDILTYGATVQTLKVPDRRGRAEDITLGFDTISDYESQNVPYFGALVGRVANRISNASFQVDGHNYYLVKNNGPHHLHGGPKGWSKAVWKAEEIEGGVRMSHVSRDQDEGYPGEVHVTVTYILTNQNEFIIRMTAITLIHPTPINPTSHPYFNLASEGSPDLEGHQITIFADYYLPTHPDLTVTGEKVAVRGTLYDLTTPRDMKAAIAPFLGQSQTTQGFDNTFCLRGPEGKRLAARVMHSGSGRVMEIYTNQPGIQFYTSNLLNMSRSGKSGHTYRRHSAFCLETQNYPDAVNQPKFPDSVLREGSTFDHWTWFKFYTE